MSNDKIRPLIKAIAGLPEKHTGLVLDFVKQLNGEHQVKAHDFFTRSLTAFKASSEGVMPASCIGIDGLVFRESFTLNTTPLNPQEVLREKSPTENKAGLWSGSNFDSWIRPKIQNKVLTAESIPISSFTLDRSMTGEEIKRKLGKAKPFTVEEFATFINNQSELDGDIPKIKSPLDTSGNLNLFLMEKADGSASVVYTNWHSGNREWDVYANGLSNGWFDGYRVFSRNN